MTGHTDIYAKFRDAVLVSLPGTIVIDAEVRGRITVGPPRDASHGDMTTNAAMVIATVARNGWSAAFMRDDAKTAALAAFDRALAVRG